MTNATKPTKTVEQQAVELYQEQIARIRHRLPMASDKEVSEEWRKQYGDKNTRPAPDEEACGLRNPLGGGGSSGSCG